MSNLRTRCPLSEDNRSFSDHSLVTLSLVAAETEKEARRGPERIGSSSTILSIRGAFTDTSGETGPEISFGPEARLDIGREGFWAGVCETGSYTHIHTNTPFAETILGVFNAAEAENFAVTGFFTPMSSTEMSDNFSFEWLEDL
ncbi:permease component of ABC-type sugar transporter [Striga asiatica]|uniref:Permease component of ABC-type sugar transporter n=1 Tax=Striga asiatica TaxID=4170 RepID=A0A5A7PA34_STRAF|nr:permease component of ABC-type sugar transporter [Striga asiatica]